MSTRKNAAIAIVILILLFGEACKKNNSSTPSFSIAGISPNSAAFGAQITITGTNFNSSTANDIVKINGMAATVRSATATTLVVTVPKGAGTGVVAVTIDGVTETGPTLEYIYTYTVSTLAGNGTAGYQDGAAANAEFNTPYGVAADAQGNVYVADYYNHRIRKIASGVVSTLAGNGTQGFQDGVVGSAEFNSPPGLAVDASGSNIFVADEVNNRIRKISGGIVTTLAGDGNTGFVDNANGSLAEFHYPWGIALDGQGNLYVDDYANDGVRKVTSSGSVTTLAGGGYPNNGRTDGPGLSARFFLPTGITIDSKGNLYIADQNNYTVRKITPSDTVSTLAGGVQGFGDGLGTLAEFNRPAGVCADAHGNIYVADDNNQRIRMITPSGVVSTVAGTGISGIVDGPGLSAEFANPRGIAIDNLGNLYIADPQNNRIRKITVE